MGALCVGVAVFRLPEAGSSPRGAGLAPPSRRAFVGRIAVVVVVVPAVVALLNSDRGVPLALLLLLAFVAGFDWWMRRTRFGRYVFAVGGNAEAARRAGIRVDGIRVAVFALSGGSRRVAASSRRRASWR